MTRSASPGSRPSSPIFPDSCHSPLPVIPCTDSAERECPELDKIMPDKANRSYDMKKIIAAVADNGEIFEPHEHWAKNMVVAFIRIMGSPVGVIANNPRFFAGVLDVNASDKAARFIRFCDAFNIPILTFTDVPGFIPGTQQEWAGVIRHGAKLLHAYSEATVTKINVVVRKSYGGGYNAMCSKAVGADYVMAWPSAEIAVMGAEGACNIIYRREIAGAGDPAAKRAELASAYEEQFNNPYFAASLGIVDEIILPRETRKKVIALLDAFRGQGAAAAAEKTQQYPFIIIKGKSRNDREDIQSGEGSWSQGSPLEGRKNIGVLGGSRAEGSCIAPPPVLLISTYETFEGDPDCTIFLPGTVRDDPPGKKEERTVCPIRAVVIFYRFPGRRMCPSRCCGLWQNPPSITGGRSSRPWPWKYSRAASGSLRRKIRS